MIYDSSNPNLANRDYLILSKGHAAAALYSTLSEFGFINEKVLKNYNSNGSFLMGHASHKVPGVEFSTGSLGHGLPFAIGIAYGKKIKNEDNKIFVILSDGELDEGSNWEALLFASHHKLKNITVIIDYNKIQSYGSTNNIINLEPLAKKFQAFNFQVFEISGHDHNQINSTLKSESNIPKVIIAHTIKGKGIGFMENQLAWHYKNPTYDQFQLALSEIEKLQ